MPDDTVRAGRFEAAEAIEHGPALTEPAAVVVCDHATNRVPDGVEIGLPAAEMARHIAWDVGARGTALALARGLGARAVCSRFSRLVIDPNRGEDDPTLVMRLYDGTVVPGNARAGRAEIERRLDAYHRPYHRAVAAAIAAAGAEAGRAPVVLSVHSFVPSLRGRALRPWHVGLLWDRDDRLVRPLLAALAAERLDDGTALCVGDNAPYSGALEGDCMNRHATGRGLAHVLVELRHDLIETPEAQAAWGARLARVVGAVLAEAPPGRFDALAGGA
ncbi:MAG: N-formylglutamate amidohydrolase [Paracoccaceae bacterium]